MRRWRRVGARSRAAARSGSRPEYQKRNETVRYVLTATTSQGSDDLKFGHTPISDGYGTSQYANHGRPRWKMGKSPAWTIAKSVIPSAKRLIDVRQETSSRSRIAEMNVPACPIPIHHTKLMIAKAQATGMLLPHRPMPVMAVYVSAAKRAHAPSPVAASAYLRRGQGLQSGASSSSVSSRSLPRLSSTASPPVGSSRGSSGDSIAADVMSARSRGSD